MNLLFGNRKSYEEALVTLCQPLRPYYTEGGARLNLGGTTAHYGDRIAGIEGFSRPLWGLAPFYSQGGIYDLDQTYIEGFKNGTNPSHPEYWGTLYPCHQAFVEMAAMGLTLMIAPQVIWDPLSDVEKDNLVNWLYQINEQGLPENNWQFFKVMVNIGLQKVGARYSQEGIEAAITIIESCYLGDGWYSDGKSIQRDYYIAFAMHYYGLIYAKEMAVLDPERSQVFKERAAAFAKDFIYWFSEDGEALPFGRSLTYRFAQCSFFSALAYAGVEALPWGVIKGIVDRHMNWWLSKPILDREGILSIGYGYPNLHMAEGYNAPGSPYWAFKSFLILALDEGHPFWQAKAEPLPTLDAVKVLPHAGMIIQRVEKGHVIALTSGQYAGFRPVHVAEKYEKFAYSTYFGFNVPRSYYLLGQAAPDNMLSFYKNSLYHVRRTCDEVAINEERIYSKWSPLEGIVVETEIRPWGEGHMRQHTIHADAPIEAVECGFSLPQDEQHPGHSQICEGNRSAVWSPRGYSEVRLEVGEGKAEIIGCEPNTNVLHLRTILPSIRIQIPEGTTVIRTYVVGLKNPH
ncbi:MAG: DUF2264 domain-containing protein [Cellulosilyticaceae bacterium]